MFGFSKGGATGHGQLGLPLVWAFWTNSRWGGQVEGRSRSKLPPSYGPRLQ